MSQHGDNQQEQDQTLLSQQAGQVVPHSSSPARPTVGKGSTETQPSKISGHCGDDHIYLMFWFLSLGAGSLLPMSIFQVSSPAWTAFTATSASRGHAGTPKSLADSQQWALQQRRRQLPQLSPAQHPRLGRWDRAPTRWQGSASAHE